MRATPGRFGPWSSPSESVAAMIASTIGVTSTVTVSRAADILLASQPLMTRSWLPPGLPIGTGTRVA